MILPLHGPCWRSRLDWLLAKYDLWSRYQPEERAVAIFSACVYGHTESAATRLALLLLERGLNVRLYDVSHTPLSVMVGEAWRCSHIVCSTTTYNNRLYPPMHDLLTDLKELGLRGRVVGLIGNGSWVPQSPRVMQETFAAMKDMTVLEPVITLKSSAKEEQEEQLSALADALAAANAE